MMRSCGGSRGQEFNGSGKGIVTLNIFIIVPRSEEGRTQLLGCGMMKVFGVIERKGLLKQPPVILKIFTLPLTQLGLKK